MNYRQKNCKCNDYEMEKYYMNEQEDFFSNCTYPEDYYFGSNSYEDNYYEKPNHSEYKKQCNSHYEERKCNKCSHENEFKLGLGQKKHNCCFCGIFKIFRCK